MLPLMLDTETGVDEAKYYSLVLAMVAHMPPTNTRGRLRSRALKQLAKAVRSESDARATCRDTDVAAAVRVRPWLG